MAHELQYLAKYPMQSKYCGIISWSIIIVWVATQLVKPLSHWSLRDVAIILDQWFSHTYQREISRTFPEIILRWMPQDLPDDQSTLVQVTALCRQATGHYLCQCPHVASLSHNNLIANKSLNTCCFYICRTGIIIAMLESLELKRKSWLYHKVI